MIAMLKKHKSIFLLLCASMLVLLFTLSQFSGKPTQTPIDNTMHGYLFSTTGSQTPCEVTVSGLKTAYPRSNANDDTVRFEDYGGIYVDGSPLNIGHIVYPDSDADYALCTYSGNATYLFTPDVGCIIGLTDQTLLIAPVSSAQEARQLVDRLAALPGSALHADFFDSVYARMEP